MVFSTTFNKILVILWWSVLLMEEIGVPGENCRPVASHCQTLSHNDMLYRVHLSWVELVLATSVVIVTDCKGSFKLNYHMIMSTTTQQVLGY
jgi:hypothetical protein